MFSQTQRPIQKKEQDYRLLENEESSTTLFTQKSLLKEIQAEYFAYFQIEFILNENIRLFKQLQRQEQEQTHIATVPPSKLVWTNPKVNLIEIAFGIFYTKTCNNGQAKLVDIINGFQLMFNVDLKEYRRAFTDVKNRKVGGLFLQEMATQLQLKINESFE